MRARLVRLSIKVSVAALALAATFAARAPGTPSRSHDLQTFFRNLDLIGFRGVGLVERDGHLELLAGAGGIVPTATFDLASIAKPITAVAVLRLAQRGELTLDSPLARFFPDTPSDKRAITVDELLTHTSGLGNATGDTAAGETDRAAAVRKILTTPLEDAPGRTFSYSNDGYTILAAVLEVVSEKRWEDVVRGEVFSPARMEGASFVGEPLPGPPAAVADDSAAAMLAARRPNWGAKGGAGILATAEDLRRFIRALVDGTLLGPSGPRELGTSHSPPGSLIPRSRVFDIAQLPGRGAEWRHGGAASDTNHFSILEYYPDARVTIIVLSVGSEPLQHVVSTGLERAVFAEGPLRLPPLRPGRPASGFASGTVLDAKGLRFTIEANGGATVLAPQNAAATTLLVAQSSQDERALSDCAETTRRLLERVKRSAATDAIPADDPEGRLVRFWRTEAVDKGAVREVTILGAVPNWVDSLGGTLAFVRVEREHGTSLFRLYWQDGALRARGGQAIPNPAPLTMIDFGDPDYGAWNPALGAYVALRFDAAAGAARRATLRATDRTVVLDVRAPASR